MSLIPFLNPTTLYTVSASDTVNLPQPSVIYIGGTGSVTVTSVHNSGTVTFQNAQAGSFLPVIIKRVWAAGLTCSGIIGGY